MVVEFSVKSNKCNKELQKCHNKDNHVSMTITGHITEFMNGRKMSPKMSSKMYFFYKG